MLSETAQINKPMIRVSLHKRLHHHVVRHCNLPIPPLTAPLHSVVSSNTLRERQYSALNWFSMVFKPPHYYRRFSKTVDEWDQACTMHNKCTELDTIISQIYEFFYSQHHVSLFWIISFNLDLSTINELW